MHVWKEFVVSMETGAASGKAGLLSNKLEVDLPPWKWVEASMEVDGSSREPLWK